MGLAGQGGNESPGMGWLVLHCVKLSSGLWDVCDPSSRSIRGEGSSTLGFVGRQVECQDFERKTELCNALDIEIKEAACSKPENEALENLFDFFFLDSFV